MKRLRTFLLFASLFAAFSFDGRSQPVQNVTIQPDCVIVINFTTVGQFSPTAPNTGYNNKTGGCTTWAMQIAVSGFSSASVTLQSAPDNAGVAGTWVTFANGTIISPTPNNVNPIVTSTAGNLWEVGAAAWVRALFSAGSGTGTVTGTLFGCRQPNCSLNGVGGGPGTSVSATIVAPLGSQLAAASVSVALPSDQLPLKVQGNAAAGAPVSGNPQLIAGKDGSGNAQDFATDSAGGMYQWSACDSQAIVTLSGTGYNSVVSGTASQVIRICNVAVTSASGGVPNVNTFSLAFGTCAGSPTEAVNLAGVTGYTDQFFGSLRGASAAAFCVSEAVANGDKIAVTYKKAAF